MDSFYADDLDNEINIGNGSAIRVYLAWEVDARIDELELALRQIRNSCVDEDDKANELFRLSPAELRKIADVALGL